MRMLQRADELPEEGRYACGGQRPREVDGWFAGRAVHREGEGGWRDGGGDKTGEERVF